MTRPERIWIVGQPFEIIYIDGERHAASQLKRGDDHLSGRTQVHYQRLVVDSDQAPDQIKDTTLHEVVHACLILAGSRPKDRDDEEAAVQALGALLLQVIRDNPALIAWLQER